MCYKTCSPNIILLPVHMYVCWALRNPSNLLFPNDQLFARPEPSQAVSPGPARWSSLCLRWTASSSPALAAGCKLAIPSDQIPGFKHTPGKPGPDSTGWALEASCLWKNGVDESRRHLRGTRRNSCWCCKSATSPTATRVQSALFQRNMFFSTKNEGSGSSVVSRWLAA